MARSIEYNPQEVLTKTMYLFWEKGYEATSIQDIVAVTGLKPGSLYSAYGSKEGIFKAVLEMYQNQSLKEVREILEAKGDVLQNVKIFFNFVIVKAISNEVNEGCLLVKTLLVVSHKDKKVQEQIVKFYQELAPILKNAIKKLKKRGETSVNPDMFTKFAFSTIYGSHVHYKTFKDKTILEDNVQFLMQGLKQC